MKYEGAILILPEILSWPTYKGFIAFYDLSYPQQLNKAKPDYKRKKNKANPQLFKDS